MVDLRSLSPLDEDLLARCVRETGRVVVVHEAPRTLGMGAEVAARVMELAFDFLEAPVARVTGWDVPYPPASLEDRYLPSVERIAARGAEGGGVLMAERVFAMPDLGEGLEEGEIVAWLVAEGDAVELNQPLVEVETAKAAVEIPSPFAGRRGRAARGGRGGHPRRGAVGDVRRWLEGGEAWVRRGRRSACQAIPNLAPRRPRRLAPAAPAERLRRRRRDAGGAEAGEELGVDLAASSGRGLRGG